MQFLLFLILFNISFAVDEKVAPKEQPHAVDMNRQFDNIQKKWIKRYNGKEGIKQFEQDVEVKAIEVIERIKEENEGKSGLKPLVKAFDDLLKKDEGGNVLGLKNINDFQKEVDTQVQDYIKRTSKKRIEKNKEEEKIKQAEPVVFDYKLAQEEEQNEKNHIKKKVINMSEKQVPISKEKKYPLIPFFICAILSLIFLWLGWKKWR